MNRNFGETEPRSPMHIPAVANPSPRLVRRRSVSRGVALLPFQQGAASEPANQRTNQSANQPGRQAGRQSVRPLHLVFLFFLKPLSQPREFGGDEGGKRAGAHNGGKHAIAAALPVSGTAGRWAWCRVGQADSWCGLAGGRGAGPTGTSRTLGFEGPDVG